MHTLAIDFTEKGAALCGLAKDCPDFDVRFTRLAAGDYVIDDAVVVERKTDADFAASVADGRLFPQVAAMARGTQRPVLLLEGPPAVQVPGVPRHALAGAIASIGLMWRVPVIRTDDPEESLRVLRYMAAQAQRARSVVLPRYDRRPKRLETQRLYVLQGLPGIGPALAGRLLLRFGTVERVVIADEEELRQVPGVGAAKAARIRRLLSS